jgi:glycosyltransferase 2 family protein
VVASVFPFTPGGAGVQQALLATIFAKTVSDPATVAAFSVGQQIATAVLSSALGFAALILIFRFRSFREVIERGKEHRRSEVAAAAAARAAAGRAGAGAEAGTGPTAGAPPPRSPRVQT